MTGDAPSEDGTLAADDGPVSLDEVERAEAMRAARYHAGIATGVTLTRPGND
jgi:hypothetical protein